MAERDWQCPNVDRCSLFPILETEVRLRVCLETYCLDDFASCARYQFVQQHKRMPPAELLPTGGTLEQLPPSADSVDPPRHNQD